MYRLIGVVVFLCVGCTRAPLYRPYDERVLAHRLPTERAMRVVLTHVLKAGWKVVDVSSSHVEATSPATQLLDVMVRDHWFVRVEPLSVHLRRRFEVSFDGVTWEGADQVNPTYTYAQENTVARALRDELDAVQIAMTDASLLSGIVR